MVQIIRLRRVDRLLQAALELAPVNQASQRIMACLIGYLPGDAPQLADVV